MPDPALNVLDVRADLSIDHQVGPIERRGDDLSWNVQLPGRVVMRSGFHVAPHLVCADDR